MRFQETSGSDIINIEDFAYAWRLTDAKWHDVSLDMLMQIRPLSMQRSQSVEMQSRAFRNRRPYSLNFEQYHIVQDTPLVKNDNHDKMRIREWFAGLPLNPHDTVYVSWANAEPSVAVVTTWSIFVELWNDLWYPFDAVGVFDETLNWALLLGPEEFAVYAERNALMRIE